MRGTQGETLSPAITLNLICLDAPLVALAWQQLFGRSLSLRVATAASIALFATAWLIYLVDRIADSWILSSNAEMSLRQRFAHNNRTLLGCAVAIAAITDAVAIPNLDRATLRAGAIVGCILVIYLALNHFVSRVWRVIPLKELAIGVLFAAGVCASLDGGRAIPFLLASTFAALCALNCISIAFWERDLDVVQKRSSIATTLPKARGMPALGCAVLAVLALVLPHQSVPFLCIAVSAGLLSILNFRSFGIARDTRTALADLVLLTPLVALAFSS